ncbi:MAG: hypothetical protein RBG13Loki_2360 [Promethearchaeota archaeon CR_4]|nr:MAG: hypothetical protein RBG13Loki_2360 [Candidatus Lokiarchaeota archaeon CR_4]
MTGKTSTQATKISLTLPEDISTSVKLLATHEDRTFSNMVAVLLKEALIGRGIPLINASEWVKRNIQMKERPEAVLAQVPRFFNLKDFIEKFKALPSWDLDKESPIESAIKDQVKIRYENYPHITPVLHKARFFFDEERFLLEVPLFSKTK